MACDARSKKLAPLREEYGLYDINESADALGLSVTRLRDLGANGSFPEPLGKLLGVVVWDRCYIERISSVARVLHGVNESSSGVAFAAAAVRAADTGELPLEGAREEVTAQFKREKRALAMMGRIKAVAPHRRPEAIVAEASGLAVSADGRAIKAKKEKEVAE